MASGASSFTNDDHHGLATLGSNFQKRLPLKDHQKLFKHLKDEVLGELPNKESMISAGRNPGGATNKINNAQFFSIIYFHEMDISSKRTLKNVKRVGTFPLLLVQEFLL